METKTCTMCGNEKKITEFRKYPGIHQHKRYPYCCECEQIENRRRYLAKKVKQDTITTEEYCELRDIERLYEKRLEKGLKTFGMRGDQSVKKLVDRHMDDLDKMYI